MSLRFIQIYMEKSMNHSHTQKEKDSHERQGRVAYRMHMYHLWLDKTLPRSLAQDSVFSNANRLQAQSVPGCLYTLH